MFERYTEKARQPAERPGAPTQNPAEILDELRREFTPIVRRLPLEIEPATVFRLDSGKEAGS